MKFKILPLFFLVTLNCAPKALNILLINNRESKIEHEKRIPFKMNFTLSDKAKRTKFNVLELLSSTLVSEARLDIEGKMFPVELIYDYDEIQDLKIYQNQYFWSSANFMIVPFLPSLLYANHESDEFIVTGYLVKYEDK